ncbi:MAG: hypothetical protein M1114_03045 [Candidatus Dependentiae bacterium]|nr:hypothetical protein [Candidatus Dependentiae bacterium]
MKKIILVTSALATLFGTCFGMDPFQQGSYHFTITHSQTTHIKVFTPRIVYPLPSVPGLSHQVETEKSSLEFLAITAQHADPIATRPSSTATGTLQPNSAQPPIDKTIAKQLAHLHQNSTKKITVGMKTVSRSQFKCDACNFEIDNKIDFMVHQLSHVHTIKTWQRADSTFNEYKFKCYDCMVGFNRKEKLDSHLLTDAHRAKVGLPPLAWDEKPYKCAICRKGFTSPNYKTEHKKTLKHLKNIAASKKMIPL